MERKSCYLTNFLGRPPILSPDVMPAGLKPPPAPPQAPKAPSDFSQAPPTPPQAPSDFSQDVLF